MINRLILIVTMLYGTISTANAQGIRYADLKVKFLTPDSTSVFSSPVVIPFTFRVYNQGPDTIWPEDSLQYRITHSLVNNNPNETIAWGKMVAKGDSIDFSGKVYVNSAKTFDKFYLYFGQVPQAFGKTTGKGILFPETNETQKDNNDVVTFKLLGSSTVSGNKLSQINIYPNPITDNELTIHGIANISQVNLYNNTMQLISEISPNNTNSTSTTIPIGNVPRGIYFVQINTPTESYTKRVMVNP